MKQGSQKRKGNQYEIEISRIFSRWYESAFKIEERADYFWRTAGSGAKATVTRQANTSFTGDITFLPNPNAMQVWIDAKNRKDITFDNIFSERFIVKKWYEEEKRKKNILGYNEEGILIIFKLHRRKENYVFYCNLDFKNIWSDKKIIYKSLYEIVLLDVFLIQVEKEKILFI